MRRDTATDPKVRTKTTEDTNSGDDGRPVRRATRIARLLKLVATTLGALVGVAKAVGLI